MQKYDLEANVKLIMQAGRMVELVKCLSYKPGDLSPIPRTYVRNTQASMVAVVMKYNAAAAGVPGRPVPRCDPEKSRHATDLI